MKTAEELNQIANELDIHIDSQEIIEKAKRNCQDSTNFFELSEKTIAILRITIQDKIAQQLRDMFIKGMTERGASLLIPDKNDMKDWYDELARRLVYEDVDLPYVKAFINKDVRSYSGYDCCKTLEQLVEWFGTIHPVPVKSFWNWFSENMRLLEERNIEEEYKNWLYKHEQQLHDIFLKEHFRDILFGLTFYDEGEKKDDPEIENYGVAIAKECNGNAGAEQDDVFQDVYDRFTSTNVQMREYGRPAADPALRGIHIMEKKT